MRNLGPVRSFGDGHSPYIRSSLSDIGRPFSGRESILGQLPTINLLIEETVAKEAGNLYRLKQLTNSSCWREVSCSNQFSYLLKNFK